MKTKDIKIGERYATSSSVDWYSYAGADLSIILDHGWEDGYKRWSATRTPTKTGKKVLALTLRWGQASDKTPVEQAAQYTVADFEAKKPVPKGWQLTFLLPQHVKEGWEVYTEQRERMERDRAESNRKRADDVAQKIVEMRSLQSRLATIGVEVNEYRWIIGAGRTVELTFEQLGAILGAEAIQGPSK